jgi:hypothetical protein
VLAGATAVLGHDAGLVALGLSTAALLAAAVLQLRAQWLVMTNEPAVAPAGPADELPPADTTTERLQLLRDHYVAAVNDALDAGDPGRARELADAYPDEALRVLTA